MPAILETLRSEYPALWSAIEANIEIPNEDSDVTYDDGDGSITYVSDAMAISPWECRSAQPRAPPPPDRDSERSGTQDARHRYDYGGMSGNKRRAGAAAPYPHL